MSNQNSFTETITHKFPNYFTMFTQSDEALPHISWRQYTKFVPKYSSGTSIVCHRHKSRKRNILKIFQTRKYSITTCSSSDCNNIFHKTNYITFIIKKNNDDLNSFLKYNLRYETFITNVQGKHQKNQNDCF